MRLITLITSLFFSALLVVIIFEGFSLLRTYKMESKFSPNAFFEFADLMLVERLKYAYYSRYKDPSYLFYANFSFLRDCNYDKNTMIYHCESSWISNYYSLIKGEFENVIKAERVNNKLRVTYNKTEYCFGPYFVITDIYNKKTMNVSIKDPAEIYKCVYGSTPTDLLIAFTNPINFIEYLMKGTNVVAFPYGTANLLMTNRTGYLFKVVGGEIGVMRSIKETKEI